MACSSANALRTDRWADVVGQPDPAGQLEESWVKRFSVKSRPLSDMASQLLTCELPPQHFCDKEDHKRSEDPSSGEQIDKRVTSGCDDGHGEGQDFHGDSILSRRVDAWPMSDTRQSIAITMPDKNETSSTPVVIANGAREINSLDFNRKRCLRWRSLKSDHAARRSLRFDSKELVLRSAAHLLPLVARPAQLPPGEY